MRLAKRLMFLFFFNDTATTEIYTLSLHDALPICTKSQPDRNPHRGPAREAAGQADRKSTRLNSSHRCISYAVFCLKKKYSEFISSLYHTKNMLFWHHLCTRLLA